MQDKFWWRDLTTKELDQMWVDIPVDWKMIVARFIIYLDKVDIDLSDPASDAESLETAELSFLKQKRAALDYQRKTWNAPKGRRREFEKTQRPPTEKEKRTLDTEIKELDRQIAKLGRLQGVISPDDSELQISDDGMRDLEARLANNGLSENSRRRNNNPPM